MQMRDVQRRGDLRVPTGRGYHVSPNAERGGGGPSTSTPSEAQRKRVPPIPGWCLDQPMLTVSSYGGEKRGLVFFFFSMGLHGVCEQIRSPPRGIPTRPKYFPCAAKKVSRQPGEGSAPRRENYPVRPTANQPTHLERDRHGRVGLPRVGARQRPPVLRGRCHRHRRATHRPFLLLLPPPSVLVLVIGEAMLALPP